MTSHTIHYGDDQDQLIIASDFDNLPVVETFIQHLCKRATLDDDQSDNMAIAITELVNNAIIHGNQQDATKTVTIVAHYHDDRVEIAISDQGGGFDPTQIANPTDPQNLWKQSGRGVFLVKNLIDQVEIQSDNGGTTVTLTEFRAE